MRSPTSDKMDTTVSRKMLKYSGMKVGEWYGHEGLSPIIVNSHFVRSNPAVYLLIPKK